MRRRHLSLTLACTAVVLAVTPAGSGGSSNAAASAFAVRTVRLLAADRYAAAWPSLHPVHRRAVGSRQRYVHCELLAPVAREVAAVDGVAVWDEITTIAGIGRVRTKAVTVRISFDPEAETAQTVTHAVHVLPFRGAWRWVLPRASYEAYRRGGCP